MKSFCLIACLALFLPAVAGAQVRSLSTDPRIKIVDYVDNKVIEIEASPFIGTVIQFLPDENIMQPIAFGDPSAWDAQMLSPRDLQISPIVDVPDTNMTVRTDKRYYYFYIKKSKAGREGATFTVRISDPNLEEMTRRATNKVPTSQSWTVNPVKSDPAAPATTDAPPKPMAYLYESVPSELWHFKYKTKGDKEIGLDQVFDNGVKTYFSFKENSPIPAVFIKRNGSEALVQTVPTPEGYLIALTVGDEWVLRRGSAEIHVTRQR